MNWVIASAASSAENFSGISRVGSNWKIIKPPKQEEFFTEINM